jgi:WD40 repeat protein
MWKDDCFCFPWSDYCLLWLNSPPFFSLSTHLTNFDLQLLVPDPRMWRTIDDPKVAERIWLRPCLQEIYDLNWSPDSQFVIAGSIDSKAEILRVKDRNALGLRGHTSYVQGVAWDPMNQMVVTQSADRSCRVHLVCRSSSSFCFILPQLKHRDGSMVKLATKGHSVIKMFGSQPSVSTVDGGETKGDTPSTPPRSEVESSGRMSPTNQSAGGILKGVNLFADSSVATCFFR